MAKRFVVGLSAKYVSAHKTSAEKERFGINCRNGFDSSTRCLTFERGLA
jgi:hypothetical protein